jgi:hypothetical protein
VAVRITDLEIASILGTQPESDGAELDETRARKPSRTTHNNCGSLLRAGSPAFQLREKRFGPFLRIGQLAAFIGEIALAGDW